MDGTGAVSLIVADSESDPDSEAKLYKDRNHLQLRSWRSASRRNFCPSTSIAA